MTAALKERDAELRRTLEELHLHAVTDPLTGLNNRRQLWVFLERELLRARRAATPVAVVAIDLDHFKSINDKWGHEAGDLVLKSAASVIMQNIRGSDIAVRSGGEEMILVLSEATAAVAASRAETIRRGIQALKLECGGRTIGEVTGSFGVAVFPDDAGDPDALMRAADHALYEAKTKGRNQVVTYAAGMDRNHAGTNEKPAR